MKNKISRRDFIKLTLLSFSATILTACERAIKPVATNFPTLTVNPSATNTPQPTESRTPKPTSTETQTPTPTEIPCFRLLTPENGAKRNAIGKVTFSWEAMQGAVNYKLEIILPSSQSIIFETNNTSRDQYLEALRMGGVFQWKVTAFDVNGTIICSAEPFTFEKPEYIPPAPTKKSGGNGDGGDAVGGGGETVGGGGETVGGSVVGGTVGD